MNRLVIKTDFGVGTLADLIVKDRFIKILEKLYKYEELEEQGLLIKLPCKVGDTVYLIHEVARCTPTIEPVKFGIALYNYFGKTVFLTQAEAEKALEGGRKWRALENY